MPSDGGEKRILVETEDHVTPYIIDWTPDAKHLIFQTGLYRSEVPREVYRVPANGGDPERILTYLSINSIANFRELTEKKNSRRTDLYC